MDETEKKDNKWIVLRFPDGRPLCLDKTTIQFFTSRPEDAAQTVLFLHGSNITVAENAAQVAALLGIEELPQVSKVEIPRGMMGVPIH